MFCSTNARQHSARHHLYDLRAHVRSTTIITHFACLHLLQIIYAPTTTESANIVSALQFGWSPKDPKLSALVTDQGQLLLGLLGEPLQPVDTYSSVTCVSWSPDGQLLAVASGQQVHIYNAYQRTACFDTNIEHQVGCQHYSNLLNAT